MTRYTLLRLWWSPALYWLRVVAHWLIVPMDWHTAREAAE
jgi:hypothetical protein